VLTVASEQRPLPPIAARVDRALCGLDDRIDWLRAFSPFDSHRLWHDFVASGYRDVPPLAYQTRDPELPAVRQRLLELPVADVELPALRALLHEKQREIDRHIELIALRDTDGVLAASIDLWGDVEPGLRAQAEATMQSLRGQHQSGGEVGLETVLPAARELLARYRDRDPRLASRIVVDDDLNSKLMVSQGHLHIDRNIRVPRDQVEPLMQHEIGTHVVTRHNGSLQPIEQLGTGLAHYDSLQEGLGVLSEYLSGHLSADRLRVLAARVIATDMVCHGACVPEIFHRLIESELDAHDAFDVALRAGRGGGLTKDVVYLRGLCDLLAYLARGGTLEWLFVGKFSLSQLAALEQLAGAGHVIEPALLPTYLDTDLGRARLERCRGLTVTELAAEDLPA
jgi:uncharacterized protein (TIGR02421 family)